MESYLGYREDLAREAEEASYGSFVRNLVFLPTVREIRQSVATMPGLHPPTLERVMANLAAEWQREGYSAKVQLLDYVKTLIGSYLPGPVPEADSISGTSSLLEFLLNTQNALQMRTALAMHRKWVNGDLLNAARAAVVSAGPTSPSKEACLAMYLIARAIGDRNEIVTGLLMWGAFCRQNKAISHAERHFQHASALATDLDDPHIRLTVMGAQAGLYRAMNRYQDACVMLEEGLALAGATADGALIVASFANGLASCYRALGQTAKALDAVNRLIAVADKSPGKMSEALNFRGLLYEDLGRYEIGAMDYAKAAKIAADEGDRSQQFSAMTNAAASLLKRKMPREGYHAFLDVLHMAERWGNLRMVASTHNNLGHALLDMENYGAARAEFGKALHAKINSHDKAGEVITFLGLGDCEKELGNPDMAEASYVAAMIPALESRDATLIAQVQLALVDENKVEGDFAEEVEFIRRVRHMVRDQAHPLLEALLVKQIAALLKKAGQIDEAMAECRALLESRSGDSEIAGLLVVSMEYARLLAARAECWPEAFALLLARLKAAERQMDETLIDARLGEIAGSVRPVYGALLELLGSPSARAVEHRSPQTFAFDLHESAKARSLLAHVAGAATFAPPAVVPIELREMESALLAEQRKWQEQEVRSEEQRYEKLSHIRQALKDCWERMRTSAPNYVRARSNEPYTFEEIHEALRATSTVETALVSFFVGIDATYCFVMRTDCDEPIMISIPLRETDVTHAALYLQRAFNGAPEEFPPYPPIRGDMPFRRKLDFLDRLSAAVSPLFTCLEGVELICVAPHGPLHTIPLHALQLPGGQYLAEKHAVVYTPSLSIAWNMAQRANTNIAPFGRKQRALVAGVSSADDTHPERFEGDVALFNPDFWELQTAVGVEGANREAIISGLRGQRVVHISCHAYFNARNPPSSGLVLTNGELKAPRDLSRLSFMERQSFIVTVRDLMRVELEAELVTLSACSTGLQRDRNAGDELEGFARALLRAGAGSALLAMWNVDQSSSGELLSRFYRNWSVRGLPKWKALQVAQKELIECGGNLAHPYHWAPFSLIGSWR
ncbi:MULTISPECIES: CHAT domain-containing protein [unclassified Burkholderia]|uniref:CHAT domain-containing protein n=1 Tax=unclassified Burkholderia TaxID=2613784 RepID=UPI00142343D6|nr:MULTISPECIES: CHAT domain-containing protein [unclassified Burkholderia]NIE59625.1 CHAT domain-containing protein [Burkholderia sp. Ap-955]NIF11712.1 CHAT domain-containing protein [Burkholderia sp. Ax-1735]NIG04559.1 CHAT domain-containing protein [Burkholderia sp. Tr-849]